MQDIVDTSDARSVEICGESWNRPVVKPTSFDLDQNNRISRRSQKTTYFVKIVSNLILIKITHFQDARKEHILRKSFQI